ncbi:lysosomal-trafficking regulator isoform X2 [Nasonia vitripennis]|uniref:Lysosomal-trafficking regulator n=1 Tax=Nasonia vitripennis TaxID=7425 RepID=A0A7M7IUC9_NASVI|nr:lysosomal-trafficking regulator isoform X2 [Nasonia vitripennis]
MSSSSNNKLRILWEHFIHAEPQSYEKSCWLDVFLAELLAQLKEGHDVKDALSFWSVGEGSVATLVGCELLSDVHRLCEASQTATSAGSSSIGAAGSNVGLELRGLHNYLVRERGWRCLAVLQHLGLRELSCARELVALLLAFYPLLSSQQVDQEPAGASVPPTPNPYISLYTNDESFESLPITLQRRRKKRRRRRNNGRKLKDEDRDRQKLGKGSCSVKEGGEDQSLNRRRRKRRSCTQSYLHQRANNSQLQHDLSKAQLSWSENQSSESEQLSEMDHSRSMALKIRLNPMDFEYFTSIVRSEDELARKWQLSPEEGDARLNVRVNDHERSSGLSRSSSGSRKTSPQDMLDERSKAVLECGITQYESSLLIIQLLLALQEQEMRPESSPAMHVLKFALDTLWSLQFANDSVPFSGLECATLKAAAARLMLSSLERALEADEPTTAVIHNGLLPMTFRLLEDACCKPIPNGTSPEEGSLLQEFIFATIHAVITFLYFLLQQRGTADKFKDFLELFQLFTESQEGKLVERTILAIVELPSADSNKSLNRARKVIDMIGMLMSTLKRTRQELSHINHCRRSKHKICHEQESNETHHHADVLGVPYFSDPAHVVTARASLSKSVCSISSLFSTFTSLLKESHAFSPELQLRLIKVMTMTGTCCCFPPKFLLASVICFLKKANCQAYSPVVSLLERTVFKELGGYPNAEDTCNSCSALNIYSWDFLELYVEVLNPENNKLCHAMMRHLLKVTPHSIFAVKQELLFRVFYPTFLKAKSMFEANKAEFSVLKFLIQSCLSAISSLIVNPAMFQKFMELGGLKEALSLLSNQAFVKSVYALLEISVIMEIKNVECNEENNDDGAKNARPAAKALFDFMEKETNAIMNLLEKVADENENSQNDEESLKQKSAFHQASGVWRAAAGVVLCSPQFRPELVNHPIFDELILLAKALAISIATDKFNGKNKFALRVMEAVVTCCLISSFSTKYNIVAILADTLLDPKVKLSRGLSALVEIFLQVSMLRPSQEQTVPHQSRTTLSTMTMDISTDWGEADDSSTGEYVTADDGYEADIEVPVKNSQDVLSKRINHFGRAPETIRGNANAHPALCSLTIDLLICFAKQGLDEERNTIVTNGLRRVAVICKESALSCASLAGTGAITRILQGFKEILESRELQYQDLQHAALEVFTLLAMQSISPTELVSYLAFFKVSSPPLLSLLEPLFRLVLKAKPQPNFILSFPVTCNVPVATKINNDDYRNSEKAENLVNNFRKKHLALEICSPWSVHAICLPIGSEMSWPVWLHGCSVSLWLRIERGCVTTSCRNLQMMSDIKPLLDSESDSLSDWGVLSDNWSREVIVGSSSPPTPTSILHMISIGFESLVLETWLDLRSDKLILRLTRPDDKTNRTISETSIHGVLPSGGWHHLAMNFNDTILNKHSAVVEVVIWIDGWINIKAQLPFDGLLIRKPGTTCVLLGQMGPSAIGAWYLSNLMIFRCPVFTSETALYVASLGPNFTNLADCIISNMKPDFAPLITSGALNGFAERKYDVGKFDSNRKKTHGETRNAVEVQISDTKIDWDSVMDATNSHLTELQDNLLLIYEAQNPNIVHLYPQAVANTNAAIKNLFPGQPAFRVVSVPEHRVSQQPPLSVLPIMSVHIHCQHYKGLVSSAALIGGVPVFLYLFARVVELNSTEEEQALALSVVLHLARSDSEMLNQYRTEGGVSLLLKVLESPRCYAGKHMLKAILDASCDCPILVKDIGTKNHLILQHSEAVITDPELIKCALEAWRTWAAYDALNLLLQTMLFLLRDQHPQREFNASQLNRIRIVDTILVMCKEHFMYEEVNVSLDPTTGSAVVELIRALMGAPPEFPHLVSITDYLVLVHQASETYITHSRHNMYFLLAPLEEAKSCSGKSLLGSSSNESISSAIENTKLNKALTNVQIQKEQALKDRNVDKIQQDNDTSSQGQDTSAGEDSGIAASEGSNKQTNEKQSVWSDMKRVCQGLVCEGLLLLLRDALRVLPDSQVGSVLKHVLRVELLLVLSNNPDARVRTALIKVIQVYLQRTTDEEVNRFIKQKYFVHLANQISLYAGSEPLVVTLENLALKGPSLAAMPPVLAMIPRAAATDLNVARPLVAFLTDLVTRNPNALRILLEQGLMESLSRGLVNAAHISPSASLFRDLHVLLVAIATKLLDSPGSHHMQAVTDMHVILNHTELKERSQCGVSKVCVTAVRDAQVALFDGELDILTAKVSNHSGFRLKSTASYLASSSYMNNALTTSSEQSDHGSRSSSYGSLHVNLNTMREPGKGELNERFRLILNRAVDFLTTADDLPSASELQLTKRLFSILLHGISSPLGKKTYWINAWSVKPALRKNTARIMVWLMSPHQNNSTRVYAVRSLTEEPKAREILSTLLEVHPQVEQKFSVFLWDLLQKKDEMPSADARICAELREALKIWDLARGIEQGNSETWLEELSLLRRELMKERDIWIESQMPAIQRLCNRYEPLAKQLTESAMAITRTVVEEQNRERKVLMERLKHCRGLEAQAMAKWRDLAKRLTHEKAPWFFPGSYPTSWELDPTEGPARVRIRLQRCHLNIDKRFFLPEYANKLEANNVEAPLSYLFTNGKQDANATALIERLHTTERIRKMSQASVVTPQAELAGEALIGETCFYFVPENPNMPLQTDIALGGVDLAMAGGSAWRLEDIRELHRRRYQLQERAIEIFLITGRTYLLAFNSSKERDEFALELSNCNLPRRVPGDDLGEALALWRSGTLTNWEYITCLNKLAGRSYNDLMQYPVFPFVLADYTSEKIDLTNATIYRNFRRPMAVQDKKNEQHYINNYNYLKQALSEGLNLVALNQEPFHYGSHYSNSGTVLHFLVRLPPFTSMFLNYQDDNFDIPDRTFHALATTWRLTSCDSTTDVKELIPEFFYLPEFLLNFEGFNFGVRQNGNRVGDVELPNWCGGDARLFILAHRAALESEIVREVLPFWIDLVFGFRQTGKPAVEAINVFHPATYYGFNVEQIADPLERQAWETMVKTYGQTPAQLFRASHPLPIQNMTLSTPTNIPPVIEGVEGIKWGNYVGAPGNEPIVCWKHKHRVLLASLIPLVTGDVFGLPVCTTLILAYSKDRGASMLSSTSIMGAGLASWNSTDGIARLKTKKEQPPRPLIKASGLDPVTIMKSSPDCGQFWIGYVSGRIVVYACSVSIAGKIEFSPASPSVLLAHRNRITNIELSRAFSIAVSGDNEGVFVIWDLNSLTYVRSISRDQHCPITSMAISETLGDIAVVYQISSSSASDAENRSELQVYTINAKLVGSVISRSKITALCYSNAVEGVSVNVIATGLDNGVIRLWSSWDLRLVREISSSSKGCGGIIAITWSCDQHHLYAATEDCTVIIWEGARKLSNGTPKFVNLTTL